MSVFDLVELERCTDQYMVSLIKDSRVIIRGFTYKASWFEPSGALRKHVTQRIVDFLWAAKDVGNEALNFVADNKDNIGHMLFLSQQGLAEPFHVEGQPVLEELASGAPFTELVRNGSGFLVMTD